MAELRQGPALSTRLKQRKTASHVVAPSSAGSTQLGRQHGPDPACSGGPGLLPPPAGAAAVPALSKGEACTPLLAALVGTPPGFPEQQNLTLPTRGAGRSWHGQGAPRQRWGCPLPLCREPHTGRPGSSADTPSMGRGSCKHTRGDGENREILGTEGGLWGSRLRKAAE